jgi:ferritin-like metal-binding protein YciE
MTEMTKRDSTVVHYLSEAYANERRLELALATHVEATTRPEYAQRLREHLRETTAHAAKVGRRIEALGGTPDSTPISVPEGLADKLESAQGVVQRATAAVQHSLQAVRRTGEQELMLENARTEFRDEAQEIATYRLLDGLATAVGDVETARLAREILREEERMAAYLGALIPQLATDVVHDEVPVSEIDGPAAHRTGAAGAGAGTSTRRRASARARPRAGRATARRRASRPAAARTARSTRRASRARGATGRTRAARRGGSRTGSPRGAAGRTTAARRGGSRAGRSRGAAGRTRAARRGGSRTRR